MNIERLIIAIAGWIMSMILTLIFARYAEYRFKNIKHQGRKHPEEVFSIRSVGKSFWYRAYEV